MNYYHDIFSIKRDLEYAQTVADLVAVKARLDVMITKYARVTTAKLKESRLELLDERIEAEK